MAKHDSITPDSVQESSNGTSKLDIDAEVAAMQQQTVKQLQRRYEELLNEEARSGNKIWLIKRIAWRLQANAYGDLSQRARRRASELANDADIRMKAPKRQPPIGGRKIKTVASKAAVSVSNKDRKPIPGTVLTRIYKGRKIIVTVLANGFECEEVVYSSLSGIAKAITGSHWNGYHFFGLNKKGENS